MLFMCFSTTLKFLLNFVDLGSTKTCTFLSCSKSLFMNGTDHALIKLFDIVVYFLLLLIFQISIVPIFLKFLGDFIFNCSYFFMSTHEPFEYASWSLAGPQICSCVFKEHLLYRLWKLEVRDTFLSRWVLLPSSLTAFTPSSSRYIIKMLYFCLKKLWMFFSFRISWQGSNLDWVR